MSARKLVLETAKFNVITGYSKEELLQLANKFPESDAAVIHKDLVAKNLNGLIDEVKRLMRGRPVILISNTKHEDAGLADHVVDSHEPEELLTLLRKLFGDPRPAAGEQKSN
ncbi:MAG TPA: hypothetical protein VF786_11035 [Terriglobales bacterium]